MSTSTISRTTVVGVFEDRGMAQTAVSELRRAGFREDQIGVVARHGEAVEEVAVEHSSAAGEGAVAGMVAGAGIGGLWALGIAAGLLPGIGPVIAGGIFASILASAAAAAAAGGVLGALIGLGIPEEEARYYESEFHSGRTIVTVQADDRYDEAYAILLNYGAYDVNTPKASQEVHTAGEAVRKPR
jgi:hypothetical protein